MYLLWIIRVVFVLIVYVVCVAAQETVGTSLMGSWFPYLMTALAASLVVLEVVFQKNYLRTLVAFLLGLMVGVGLTYVIAAFLRLIVPDQYHEAYLNNLIPIFGLFVTYLCVTIVLQTKDHFRFIVPYVEFSKQGPPTGGYLLDTSAVIDGRVVELCDAGLFSEPILIPEFVVRELHQLSDSADRLKREKGRKGLELLRRLEDRDRPEVSVRPGTYPDIPEVDDKLIRAAKETDTRLVTADGNLAKVARVEGVEVTDIHELALRFHMVVSVGDEITVQLIRPGEAEGQAVGFLDDGSMVVVEQARDRVGKSAGVIVGRVIQTSGGRMIFARLARKTDGEAQSADGKSER